MPAFTHAEIMTDSATISRDALCRTVVGMAHFAGTGPERTACGQCAFWVPARKKTICGKYHQMMRDDKKAIPAGTPSCRYFEQRKPA